MTERAPYSRVYWSIVDDPKFATIFDDDANLAAWLRLLLIADQAYPASAHLPQNCKRRAVKALADAGIIDLTGSRYRIHGLTAERERRRAAATTRGPNADRTGTVTSPNGQLAEPSQAEESQADAPRDVADIYWELTGKFPQGNALSWVDGLAEQYGSEIAARALIACHLEDRSVQTLLGRTRDRLASEARKLDLKERAAEKQRIAEKRAQPRQEKPWMAEYRALIERQYREAS